MHIGGDRSAASTVKEILSMPIIQDQFTVCGRIEWVDEASRYGSGITEGKVVRKGILHDLYIEGANIEVDVWGKSYENQYPISKLKEGCSYRLEFMKFSKTNTSNGKALTSTPKTKVFRIK